MKKGHDSLCFVTNKEVNHGRQHRWLERNDWGVDGVVREYRTDSLFPSCVASDSGSGEESEGVVFRDRRTSLGGFLFRDSPDDESTDSSIGGLGEEELEWDRFGKGIGFVCQKGGMEFVV